VGKAEQLRHCIPFTIFNYGRIENSMRIQDALCQQALLNYQNAVLLSPPEVADGRHLLG
jgi:hypothetical protein